MITDAGNPEHWLLLARDRLEKADAIFVQFGPSWVGSSFFTKLQSVF